MPPRRSKPMLLAPLIPFWGLIAFYGVDELHGTRYLIPFAAFMVLLLAILFAWALNGTLQARRARSSR